MQETVQGKVKSSNLIKLL